MFIHVFFVLSIMQFDMVTLKCIIKRETYAANNAVCFPLYHGSNKNKFAFSFPRCVCFFFTLSRNVSNFVTVKDFPIKPFGMTVPSGSFTCSLIYSFIKYILSIFVPSTVLGTGITLKNKAPLFQKLIYLWES